MSSVTHRKKEIHKKGDIVIEAATNIRRKYDGNKWRRLCSINHCDTKAQLYGLCARHIKKVNEEPQSLRHLPIEDFVMLMHDETREYLEENVRQNRESITEEQSVHQNITSNSIPGISAFPCDPIPCTNPKNVSVSSITIAPSDTLIRYPSEQNINVKLHSCQYSPSSTATYDCRQTATYNCPHCPSSFCLQHGLQHQQDLKEEIRKQLTDAQELFNNIQRLNINSGKSSCAVLIDQWEARMQAKIHEKRHELQTKVNQFDEQVELNKEYWKIFLKDQLEQKVGCVLTEESEKYEIVGTEWEKTRSEYFRLLELFQLFNNQQLIKIINDLDNETNFNSPIIVFPRDVLNRMNCKENTEDIMYELNRQENELTCKTNSSNEIQDTADTILINEIKTADAKIDAIINETATIEIQDISPATMVLSETEFSFTNETPSYTDEDIFEAAFAAVFEKQGNVFNLDDPQEKTITKNQESPVSTSSSFCHGKFNLETIAAKNTDDLTLDLSCQKLTDDDLEIVTHCTLQNTELIQPWVTLDVSCNQIGEKGVRYLSDALHDNTTLTTLNLNTNQIGNQGLQYLSIALQNNTTITYLDISHNNIAIPGIRHLSDALRINKTLTLLNLEHNHFGEDGVKYLSDALASNNTLKTLILNWNYMEENGAQHLSHALRVNTSITTMEIACNGIGEAGAFYFSNVLRNNSTLTALNLRFNQIGSQGTNYLSDALRINNTLTVLDLERNQIRDDGAKYLSDALRINTTLTTLNLCRNQIAQMGVEHLSDVLEVNRTLTTLDLSYNRIVMRGARYLGAAIVKNKTLINLNLKHNRMQHKGVRYLKDTLRINTTLTTLNVDNNTTGIKTEQKYLTKRLKKKKNCDKSEIIA